MSPDTYASNLASENADKGAALVSQWVAGAAVSLASDKLTPVERARLGDLSLAAATWLAERATRLAKVALQRDLQDFKASVAHLPNVERGLRIAAWLQTRK